MAKTHKVAVHGVMKINGQMAYFGEEVEQKDFDRGDQLDFDNRVKGGYIITAKEFEDRIAESNLSGDDKKKLAVEKQKKADQEVKDANKKADDAKKAHDDLLIAYLKAFSVEAPDDASDDDIQKALDAKVAIPVD